MTVLTSKIDEGSEAFARNAAHNRALATELRSSPAAETLPWVGRLLGFQIATTLAAIQRQQQQQQQRQAG